MNNAQNTPQASPFRFDPFAAQHEDRYIAISEGQFYGSFPTFAPAIKRAEDIATVTGYAEVIMNGVTIHIAA